MSVLQSFEKSMEHVFEGTTAGTSPIRMKKLLKTLSRKMKDEALIIDGVDTAPTLYTILVNKYDERIIYAQYNNLTEELESYITATAQREGYDLIDRPLVRFIANTSMRAGKFDVIAENVTRNVLRKLRSEENNYMNKGQAFVTPLKRPAAAQPPREVVNPNRATRFANDTNPPYKQVAQKPYAQIIDLATREPYELYGDKIIIGRNSQDSDIVIRDPNISRRHCKFSYSDGAWTVTDLGSTNGTYLNDVRINARTIINGDVIRIGITELEFKAK